MPNTQPQAQAHFDFNQTFQEKVAALVLRDFEFYESTRGLIEPGHFELQTTATLVALSLEFYDKYRTPITPVGFVEILKDKQATGKLRPDMVTNVATKFVDLMRTDVSDRAFVIDKVVSFAKHQAMEAAILNSADWLAKGQFDKIESAMKESLSIGVVDMSDYDLFDEVSTRSAAREAAASSNAKPTGIPTGVAEIDQRLYHHGYGRKELSCWLGPAKAGKSTALIYAAQAAALRGYNVLYVTLEVSREITSDRFDACMTDTLMSELNRDYGLVEQKLADLKRTTRLGALKIHEFPSNSWSPADAHRLVQSYRRKGIVFDMMVVDYLDIMRPNHRNEEIRENSRTIWLDMRALAQAENFAMVTATQTNRDGFKADVAGATEVAEDINKVRTIDLMISINATPEEKKKGENRLYFAASRNGEDGITIHVNTDRARMKFITNVLSVT